MEEGWKEKVSIYFHNLAPYYAFSVVISLIAMFMSWWYSKRLQEETKKIDETQSNDVLQTYSDESDEDLMDTSQAKIKVARHQAMVDKLSAGMTPEQLIEEKETEKAQLNAILNLLKEQKEKFQVADMNELEEQLSLYR